MSLIEDIILEEGFRGNPYIDTEGFSTIGHGTKLPLTKKEAHLLAEYRLNRIINSIKSSLYNLNIEDEAWEILFNMGYQMGLSRLLKFKRMIKALENQDYIEAAKEMLDSLWAKQTSNRANRLADRMREIEV